MAASTGLKGGRENYERWAALPGFDISKLHEAVALMSQDDAPLGFNPIELSKFVMQICRPSRRGRPRGKTTYPEHPNAASGKLII